jgi:hypothetical protein
LSTTVVAKAPFSLPPIYIRAPPLSEMRWERTDTCRCGAGRSSINSPPGVPPPLNPRPPSSIASLSSSLPALLQRRGARSGGRRMELRCCSPPAVARWRWWRPGQVRGNEKLRRPSLSRSIAYVRTRIVTITRGRDSDRDSMVLEAVTEVRPTVWPAVISGFSH